MTSLRRRMLEDMQVRNFSPHTQTSYVQQVSRFARHFQRSPECLGPEEIRAYQVFLTNDKKLAVGSILLAVAALRFLYTVTLKKHWTVEDIIPAPKKPQRSRCWCATDRLNTCRPFPRRLTFASFDCRREWRVPVRSALKPIRAKPVLDSFCESSCGPHS